MASFLRLSMIKMLANVHGPVMSMGERENVLADKGGHLKRPS